MIISSRSIFTIHVQKYAHQFIKNDGSEIKLTAENECEFYDIVTVYIRVRCNYFSLV